EVQCEVQALNATHDYIVMRVMTRIDRSTAPVDLSASACRLGRSIFCLDTQLASVWAQVVNGS
ncbi:hypothetical protein GOP47_0031211, partial [Adiantum capillus-veneris]